MTKRKVAILGGGMGALSTAWNLTKDPKWKDQIESLTIYQMGWRLGGKCATGRGPYGRIEEHGIHLFGGGYYNALRMMRDVYREAYGPVWQDKFEFRFQNQYTSVNVNGTEKSSFRFPPSSLTLDSLPAIASIGGMLGDAIKTLRSLFELPKPTPSVKSLIRFGDGSVSEFWGTLSPENAVIGPILEDLDRLADQVRLGAADVPIILERLGAVAGPNRLDYRLPVEVYPLDDALRSERSTHESRIEFLLPQWLSILNFIYALTNGWLTDIVGRGKSFADLDELEYDLWLSQHGAWQSTIELDGVQAPLRILYQYKDGETEKSKRSMGAGGYFHWTMRSLAYMHSPFWFFRLGTGDTVITPLYETLVARGVKFSFFNKVEKLRLSDDKGSVAEIDLRIQASSKSGQSYDPLEAGNWPSSPRFSELNDEDTLRGLPHDELESYWSNYRNNELQVLRIGEDFDEIVLAISLGALPFICSELAAKEHCWSQMISSMKTVETQSLQIWLNSSSVALGVNNDINIPIKPDDTGLGAGFSRPFDGFADFSDLVQEESWPIGVRPKSLWYFSDVLSTPSNSPDLTNPNYPQQRHAVAFSNSKRFLENELGRLLGAFSPSRGGFDYSRLVLTDGGQATDTDSILAQQVVRANVQPSDRYVQALAGTTKFRLEAGRSEHFSNLYLAGDWTYNGLNVGCVEAAVMSGMLAANDLLGRPHDNGVLGYFRR